MSQAHKEHRPAPTSIRPPGGSFFAARTGVIQKQGTGSGVATPAPILDDRPAVLDSDRTKFDQMLAFLREKQTAIIALADSTAVDTPTWMSRSNPNVASLLSLLNRLESDLASGRVIVRFDHSGTAAASYDYVGDVLHLRDFSSNPDVMLPTLLSNLVHEYAHAMQDRTETQSLISARTPRDFTAADDLEHEIGSRREETYMARFLVHLGHSVGYTPSFFDWFEAERTGTTTERDAARTNIRSTLETAYADQFRANTPARRFLIELRSGRQAYLIGENDTETALNEIPPRLTRRSAVEGLLAYRVGHLSACAGMFQLNGADHFRYLHFIIAENGQLIGGFALQPSDCETGS